MAQRKKPSPLEDLDDRLKRLREQEAGGPSKRARGMDAKGGFGLAMRISVELVASVLVGLGIGWLLDRWLGTTPWLMLVFFLLGSAAGMLNIYRVMTGIGQAVGYRSKEDRPEEKRPDDKAE